MATGHEVKMYRDIGRIADALERISPRKPPAGAQPPGGGVVRSLIARRLDAAEHEKQTEDEALVRALSEGLRDLSGRVGENWPARNVLDQCLDRWDEFARLMGVQA
jgi:hypothetical protein